MTLFSLGLSNQHQFLRERGPERSQRCFDQGRKPGGQCWRDGPCKRGSPCRSKQGQPAVCPVRRCLTRDWHRRASDSTGTKTTPPTAPRTRHLLPRHAPSKFCGRYVQSLGTASLAWSIGNEVGRPAPRVLIFAVRCSRTKNRPSKTPKCCSYSLLLCFLFQRLSVQAVFVTELLKEFVKLSLF